MRWGISLVSTDSAVWLCGVSAANGAESTDVTLDLQTVFTTTYDRAGYDYALHYERPVEPPLEANQLQWAGQRTGRAAP